MYAMEDMPNFPWGISEEYDIKVLTDLSMED
jgi:hypothetical protein